MNRDDVVMSIQDKHNLPKHLAEKVVNQDGVVNNPALELALEAVNYGKTPASSADPKLARALSESYWQAMDRGDHVGMVSLKRALHKIGADPLPRKEK